MLLHKMKMINTNLCIMQIILSWKLYFLNIVWKIEKSRVNYLLWEYQSKTVCRLVKRLVVWPLINNISSKSH